MYNLSLKYLSSGSGVNVDIGLGVVVKVGVINGDDVGFSAGVYVISGTSTKLSLGFLAQEESTVKMHIISNIFLALFMIYFPLYFEIWLVYYHTNMLISII
jgi:hypothetical protein